MFFVLKIVQICVCAPNLFLPFHLYPVLENSLQNKKKSYWIKLNNAEAGQMNQSANSFLKLAIEWGKETNIGWSFLEKKG